MKLSTNSVSMADASEEWIPLAPTSDHPSRKIRRESRFKVGFLVIAPILGYICLAVTTATVLVSVIHLHHFRISETDKLFASHDGQITFLPFDGLRQSDVTTLFSLASTLTRFLGSICCGIACWRAAYILLEREGLSLADIDSLVSFPFLRPWPWSRRRTVVSCVALLFLSSELYSPILNGSIAWKAAMSPNPHKQVLTGLTAPKQDLSMALEQFIHQQSLVYEMATYIATASAGKGNSNEDNYNPQLWRIETATNDLPINSTLANITLPFFSIDSFEWITDPELMLDPRVVDALDLHSGLLNFTSPVNPIFGSKDGYVALIPNQSWNATFPPTLERFPSRTVTGTYYVVITVVYAPFTSCEQARNQFVDSLPSGVKMYRHRRPPIDGNCVIFARISIRAGVGTCRDCRIAAPMVVRNQSTIIELEPDLMAEPAIYAMPEVSSILTNMNILQVSPKKGLERYVRETLTLHYCGTWTALAILAARRERGGLETMVQTFVQVSEATVDQPRVIAWLVLNFCVAACCAVVAFVQAFTGRKRVLIDAILAAILLDATEVVDHLGGKDGDHPRGDGESEAKGQDVCSMSVLLEDEKSTRVRLGGSGGGGSEGEEPNIHFRLVLDTQSGH